MNASIVVRTAGREVRALHPLFGADMDGIDLASLSGETLRLVGRALRDHLLLVFPRQSLAPEVQLGFTAALGAIARHPLPQLALPALPEIVLETSGRDDRDLRWHADLAWSASPNRVTVLTAADLQAGTWVTEFANQLAAYERLDPWLRERIEFLDVEHDHPRRLGAGLPAVIHPLVRVDPDTGRRALLLGGGGEARILGIPRHESDDLLHRLNAAATHPAIVLRHRWQPGDVVVWDNLGVLHRSSFTAQGRLHRTMVVGKPPVGPREVSQAWVSAG